MNDVGNVISSLAHGLPFARNSRSTSSSVAGLISMMALDRPFCRPLDLFRGLSFGAFGKTEKYLCGDMSTQVGGQTREVLAIQLCGYPLDCMLQQPRRLRSHYVKLALPMKLSEYGVRLQWYPWLEPIFFLSRGGSRAKRRRKHFHGTRHTTT